MADDNGFQYFFASGSAPAQQLSSGSFPSKCPSKVSPAANDCFHQTLRHPGIQATCYRSLVWVTRRIMGRLVQLQAKNSSAKPRHLPIQVLHHQMSHSEVARSPIMASILCTLLPKIRRILPKVPSPPSPCTDCKALAFTCDDTVLTTL